MNAERLLAYYDQVADAPDAVSRLRRFILDLAVRGKLVPQDMSEESSFQFLTNRPAIDKIQHPFEIPNSWIWANVGSVADSRLGKMLDKNKNRGSLKFYLRNINVRWFDFDLSSLLQMRFEDSELPAYELHDGDVLICEGGEPGRAAVWDCRESHVYFQKAIHRVRFRPVVNSSYFVRALRASAEDGRLADYLTGSGIKHFTGKELQRYLFPLPPLAEQHRIVAKIDELMELCDRLEAARVDREAARDRLAAASLARLNAPEAGEPRPSALALSPLPPVPGRTAMSAAAISSTQDMGNAFVGQAGFILDALPAITARPDQIKALRRAILGLAVRGQLVPQDENDQPEAVPGALASAALDGRLNIDIPQNWQWVRVEDVAEARLGKMLDKDKNKGKLYPYLRNSNVHWFDIRTDDLSAIRLNDAELEEYRLKDGDVLICEGGHGIGRTAVWRGDSRTMVFQKALHRVRVGAHLDPDFFAQCCFVYYDIGIMQAYFTGVGIQHFTGRALSKLVFPLPPLAEQNRIVAKVDELMTLCDKLEASLTTAADSRRRLLDALLAEALAPDEDRLLEAAE